MYISWFDSISCNVNRRVQVWLASSTSQVKAPLRIRTVPRLVVEQREDSNTASMKLSTARCGGRDGLQKATNTTKCASTTWMASSRCADQEIARRLGCMGVITAQNS